MRITSVDTAVVEANFDWTIVRIETDQGVTGWGEAFFAPGLSAMIGDLGELMLGRDPGNHLALLDRLRWAASGAGSSGGALLNALSGIDAALWDLNARALAIPLWRLLGGRFHDRVRAYCDCHADEGLGSLGPLLQVRPARWADPSAADAASTTTFFEADAEAGPADLASLSRRAQRVAAAGFDAVKFDVDVPGLLPRLLTGAAPDYGLLDAMIEAVRAGAGPHVDVALDCHWRYDVPTARRIAERAGGHDLLWLEDPLAPDNVSGFVELSRRTTAPLATGENLQGHRAFQPLIDAGALAVVTPDLAKLGGIDQLRMLAGAAAAAGIQVAPHNIAGPVGTAFAGHVAATLKNLVAVEFHAFDVPFFHALVDGPVVEGGSIVLHDRPGIGVEVVEDEVARWAKPGERVFGGAPPKVVR